MMPMRIPRKAAQWKKSKTSAALHACRMFLLTRQDNSDHACAMLSAAGGMRKARASLNARAAYCATPDAQLRVRRRLPKRIENPADGNCPHAICRRRGDISQPGSLPNMSHLRSEL